MRQRNLNTLESIVNRVQFDTWNDVLLISMYWTYTSNSSEEGKLKSILSRGSRNFGCVNAIVNQLFATINLILYFYNALKKLLNLEKKDDLAGWKMFTVKLKTNFCNYAKLCDFIYSKSVYWVFIKILLINV